VTTASISASDSTPSKGGINGAGLAALHDGSQFQGRASFPELCVAEVARLVAATQAPSARHPAHARRDRRCTARCRDGAPRSSSARACEPSTIVSATAPMIQRLRHAPPR
jgi:hypothetical protein